METITIKIPSWVNKEEVQKELLKNLKANAQFKLELYQSKMLPFERKYHCSFEEFQEDLESETKKSFDKWDDFIEWKAISIAVNEWENKLKELD